MDRDSILKHAFALNGFIAALAIKEALAIVVPNFLKPPEGTTGSVKMDAVRLLIFIIVIARSHIRSWIVFKHRAAASSVSEAETSPEYLADFAWTIFHFLLFVFWAYTIDTHGEKPELFPFVLAAILLLDLPIALIAIFFDWRTRQVLGKNALVSAAALVLSAFPFTPFYYNGHTDYAELAAYFIVALISVLDISEHLDNIPIFGALLKSFVDPEQQQNAQPR